MPLILILIGNFFVLICCLIGAQACYFKGKWKWLALWIVCSVVTGACIFIESYQVLVPPVPELHFVIRNPTTPL